MNSPEELRLHLFTEGSCVAPGLLGETLLQRLRKAVQPIIKSDRDSASSHFGLITACPYDDDAFAALIAWPPALQLLHEMGFEDNRWMSFYLIDKPPYSRPLWWHQDWLSWDDPMSAPARPVQVFLSYYLEDTNVVNGCLRVIPGTHLQRHEVHDVLLTHDEVPADLPPDHPMFKDVAEAVDVPVQAGDIVLGDARLVHAARANQTADHRPLLLGWYLLDFHLLSPPLQGAYSHGYGHHTFTPPAWWSGTAGRAVKTLVVDPPSGAAAAQRNRKPGTYLKR